MTTTDRRDATDAQFADELARLNRLDVADVAADVRDEALRQALRAHHPVMRSETGPFSGCRCGAVKLGQDVIQHVIDHLAAALKPAPGNDTGGQAVQRVLDLADELDSHVKPRSFHPAGTHSDGASSAYADAAARIRAAVAGPQRDHDEEGGQ